MIAGLEARARRVGEAARRRTVGQLAARLRDDVPRAGVTESVEDVTVIGRRILRDPRLVWIGSLLK